MLTCGIPPELIDGRTLGCGVAAGVIVGLGSDGSSTGSTDGFGDFSGDALGDFLPFFFFDVLGDAFAFFFFDGVGVTSSSACATLFGFFASGVSLGFTLGFGEGVLLLDFRFLGVDFGLGMGVSSGLEDAVAACKNATVPDFSEAEICAEPSRPAIPLRVIAIVSQTCNRITGASVTEPRARSSGLWLRRAIFQSSLVFAAQNGVQLSAQQQQ